MRNTAQGNHMFNGEGPVNRCALGRICDLFGAGFRGYILNILIFQMYFALFRFDQTGNGAQQGTFARAVGANKTNHLAFYKRGTYAFEDRRRGSGNINVLCF